MARRGNLKRRKGKRAAGNVSEGKVFLGRFILKYVFFVGLLVGVFFSIRYFFYSSQFFDIKEIFVSNNRDYSFDDAESKLNELYKGKNIFTVDLNQLEILMKGSFSQFKKVEARRNFPNALEVNIVSRDPVAVIDAGDGLVIDTEGIVLAAGGDTGDLVKIKGIKFFLNVPSKGEHIKNRNLQRALLLLRGLYKKIQIDKKNIDFIDISDRNNIMLSICGVIVKIGKDDFSRKLDSLKEILSDSNMDIKELRYIDLRFEEAVISPK